MSLPARYLVFDRKTEFLCREAASETTAPSSAVALNEKRDVALM
jgi:hypothetical protein